MTGGSPFWALERHGDRVALIAPDDEVTYAGLASRCDAALRHLPSNAGRSLGFLLMGADAGSIALYVACLRSRDHVPLLIQPDINPVLLGGLIERFEPDWVAGGADLPTHPDYAARSDNGGLHIVGRTSPATHPPLHPDLALLLSTSGSTGSHKLVRLSYDAIASNASAIVDYLGLVDTDRAITTLPLSYSFGLSILNSHLAVGAAVVLTGETPMTREFWTVAARTGVTSLSGVPSSFEMLRRADIAKRGLDRLRMLTQAGGRLRPETTAHFARLAADRGWRFFVMYGQTEAAPRIAYVPPERLAEKIGSIGIAIPGGALSIDGETSELVYRGPNVMMGYAEDRADLARGDDCRGVLRTGDLARCDADGYHYLTGRLKRFIKLSGSRVNLDDVEIGLERALGGQIACTGDDEALIVWLPAEGATGEAAVGESVVAEALRRLFGVHHSLARVRQIAQLPTMANGKTDYRRLAELAVAR